MRRLIDDDTTEAHPDADALSWVVSISDDFDDTRPRVLLTVEEIGRPGEGLVGVLSPAAARRLRGALERALGEIGESPG